MKIKLLPFEKARIKARRNNFRENKMAIAFVPKAKWNSEEIKEVKECDGGWVRENFGYGYPKCCCEVIEE